MGLRPYGLRRSLADFVCCFCIPEAFFMLFVEPLYLCKWVELTSTLAKDGPPGRTMLAFAYQVPAERTRFGHKRKYAV